MGGTQSTQRTRRGEGDSVEAAPMLPPELNALSDRVIGCAIEVHRQLGPGLAEAIYEAALARELELADLAFRQQVVFTREYKGVPLPVQRFDLVIEGRLLIELKAVERVADASLAQLVSYLHYADLPLGLLINFHVPLLKNGIHRRVHSAYLARRPLPPSLSASSAASAFQPLC